MKMFNASAKELLDERRREKRWPMNLPAWLDPGGTALPIQCIVQDISTGGAKLFVSSGTILPTSFFVKVGAVMHRAEVAWRRRGDHSLTFGVRFLEVEFAEVL